MPGRVAHSASRNPVFCCLHELAGPLQRDEGRVPLVEMAHLDRQVEGFDEPPAADAQDDLLHQAHLLPAAVELAGDAAVDGTVQRIVAVEQVEDHPPDLRLPDPAAHGPPRQLDRHPEPGAGGRLDGQNGKGGGVVEGIGLLLPAGRIEDLAEVAFLVQQADADDRHAEVAGRLEVVAGQNAQAAGVEGERLAQAELHAEIGDPFNPLFAMALAVPAGLGKIFLPRRRPDAAGGP